MIKPIADEWLNVICWSSGLFRTFIIKKCVELRIFFGIGK